MYRTCKYVRRTAHRRARRHLFESTAPLALLFAIAGAPQALAQSVIGSGVSPGGSINTPHWNVGATLHVGSGGTGTLNITGGGSVSDTQGIVGRNGGTGTVTVSGKDANNVASTWTNSGNLTIGLGGPDPGPGGGGNGTLTITDGGKVYSGQGDIGKEASGSSGTVGVVTVSGVGSLWSNSSVYLGLGGASGTLIIEDGGEVRTTDRVWMGDNADSVSTLRLNGDASARGVLETRSVNNANGTVTLDLNGGILRATQDEGDFLSGFDSLGVNTGGAWFDTNDNDITIDTDFSGGSTFNKLGFGQLTLTGTSSFNGATNVFAGTLTVDGSIANSAVLVYDDAILSGSGSVGATRLDSGGTIAPGTGVGTISVVGDYVQEAGAVYEVAVDPTSTSSDLIAVTGEAVLDSGAVINITKTTNAPYILGTTYTVLTTTEGLDGKFVLRGETDVTALIRLRGAYDEYNAYLLAVQSATAASVGETPNQIATGEGVDALDPSGSIGTAVLNLPDDDAVRDALDQLSGEIHASVKTATIENSHFIRDAATDRIRAAFCGVGTRAQKTDEERRLPEECAISDRPVAWGQVFGSWGSTDSDGNAAKMDRSTGGFLTGIDGQIFDAWRAGVLAGYSRSNIDVDARSSSATSDDYHLGLYGGTQWGRLGLRAGAAYTWQDIGTERSVDFEGFNDDLTADYEAGVTHIFGDLGYRIDVGRFALEPFANLAYVGLDTDGFTESGGDAALTVSGNTTDTFFTTIGLRGSASFELGGMEAQARGSVGWRHASRDTVPVSHHAFNGGPFFEIAGVPIAEDAALVNAGLDFKIAENALLSVSYGGQFSDDAIDQSARGSFSFQF
jgi:outer membrane autotransporter protein